MSLRINTNIAAMNSHRQLAGTSSALERSMQRLSSGQRINSAADDAAGLGISERMRGQIGGLAQAQRNVQDGISFVQTAEGTLQEFQSILHRIRDLALQFNNGTYSANDRAAITAEVTEIGDELGRIWESATFNGISLLTVTPGVPLVTLQIGANNNETLAVEAALLPAAAGQFLIGYFAFANATATTTQVDIAIWDSTTDMITQMRSQFGAIQNRLEHTLNVLAVQEEQTLSAESRIRDTDLAKEMTSMTGLQIRQQAGVAMLAQANNSSRAALDLLP